MLADIPSPLEGGGLGWGSTLKDGRFYHTEDHPHPNLPPERGKEQKQRSPDAAIAESGTMHEDIIHPGFHFVSSRLHGNRV